MLSALATEADLRVSCVRLRGAADGLRARRQMEGALAEIAPSALGLSRQALLIVRRVAPKARLHLGAAAPDIAFVRVVRTELEAHARQARRPWLDHDANAADAVLFADEIEFMACLLRDWVRGGLTERWWWSVVLRGSAVPQWWRRELIPRGDLLPAVLGHLATQGAAVGWVARLGPAEAAAAAGAVIEAHALILEPGDGPRPAHL